MKKVHRAVKRIRRHRARYTTQIGVDFVYNDKLVGSITVVLNDSSFDIPAEAMLEFSREILSKRTIPT